jgi:hypothetical protein
LFPDLAQIPGIIKKEGGSGLSGAVNNGFAGFNMFKTDF